MKNLDSLMSMRYNNKLRVLESTYRKSPISRMEIGKRSGLSKVTVARFVGQLINEGFIHESEFETSSGGRRPALIRLIPEARLIIGIDFGLGSVRFGLCDLKLNVKEAIEKKAKIGMTARELIKLTKESLEELKKSKYYKEDKILGIGISLPGVIDTQKGKIIHSFLLKDREIELKRKMQESFKTNIFIDKDAHIGLYNEKWLGVGMDYENILYIYTRNNEEGQMGLGVSLYLNGRIYRGANYSSGEIGLRRKREEKKGEAFEPFSSYEALPSLEYLVKTTSLREGTPLAELIEKDSLSFASIIKAAKENDEQAQSILEDIGAKIGKGVAFLVNLINPQLVIIGGDFAQAPPIFYRSLKSSVFDYGFDFATKNLEIKPASKTTEQQSICQAAFLIVGLLLDYH